MFSQFFMTFNKFYHKTFLKTDNFFQFISLHSTKLIFAITKELLSIGPLYFDPFCGVNISNEATKYRIQFTTVNIIILKLKRRKTFRKCKLRFCQMINDG